MVASRRVERSVNQDERIICMQLTKTTTTTTKKVDEMKTTTTTTQKQQILLLSTSDLMTPYKNLHRLDNFCCWGFLFCFVFFLILVTWIFISWKRQRDHHHRSCYNNNNKITRWHDTLNEQLKREKEKKKQVLVRIRKDDYRLYYIIVKYWWGKFIQLRKRIVWTDRPTGHTNRDREYRAYI